MYEILDCTITAILEELKLQVPAVTFDNVTDFPDFRFKRCEFMKILRFYVHQNKLPEYIYLYEADSRSAIQ